jgi:hypothetical protein
LQFFVKFNLKYLWVFPDPDIYEKTEIHIPPAIINAKRSVQKHVYKKVDPISEGSNPCTTVYTLMETFMKLKKQDERLRK